VKVTGDLRQKIINQLADQESHDIIAAVLREQKTAAMIGEELDLPPSTLYRKISELKECGLLMIDSFDFRPDGKREARYACSFSEILFKTKGDKIELEIIPSARGLEKRWFELFFSKRIDPSSL
jgi:DNA-binding transcriptional ArsR family regulator